MARNLCKWKVFCDFVPNSLLDSLFGTSLGMEKRQSHGLNPKTRKRTEKNADIRPSRNRNTNQGSQNSSGSKQPASHRAVTAIYRPLQNCLITVVKGPDSKHRIWVNYPTNRSSHAKRVPVTTAWRVLKLRMEERPPIWKVAANILNKQSRRADKG